MDLKEAKAIYDKIQTLRTSRKLGEAKALEAAGLSHYKYTQIRRMLVANSVIDQPKVGRHFAVTPKRDAYDKVSAYKLEHPEMTIETICQKLGVNLQQYRSQHTMLKSLGEQVLLAKPARNGGILVPPAKRADQPVAASTKKKPKLPNGVAYEPLTSRDPTATPALPIAHDPTKLMVLVGTPQQIREYFQ
jgi:hypothetical protein